MAMAPTDTLEAGVVWLRPIRETDAGPLHGVLSDQRVYEPTSYDILDLEQTRAVIARWLANEKTGHARRWAVVRAGSDSLIGTCGFHRIDPKHQVAELGYEIAPDWWRRGFATAAIGAVMQWAFTASDIRRVEAVAWVGNTASIGALEKCSFTREGLLRQYRLCRGEPRDFFLYSRLRPGAGPLNGAVLGSFNK
jgi:RimJ/RimL family protein N-acetyltransferase